MSGFNMPPGVSPSDIPGNDEPLLFPEEEAVDNKLDEIQTTSENYFEDIRRIVGDLANRATRQAMTIEDLQQQVRHLMQYAQHTPSCGKVAARLSNREGECTCGLEPL